MQAFIGTTEAKCDSKGRIFFPAAYRKILAQASDERLVMRRDADNDCLMLYPESVWNTKLQQLKSTLDEWNPDDQLLLMQYVGDAEVLELDGQGRILIQKRHLQHIGAGSALVFVAMIDRIALWDKNRYEACRLSASDFASRLSQRMQHRRSQDAVHSE
ncbi:MAG: cell division/cell wall cluster transcriptional repressor MraZ [Paludibacteraceae bacterium]|nr:cell division/cell wall cluster transcriptional repressor MraZ [Paludibacteraceae bacterium]